MITAGPMGFSCALLVFAPDQGMGFDEYFNIKDGMQPEEQYLSFALGLAPQPTHIRYMDLSRVDLSSQAGPSLNVACQLCAGMAGTEVLRILLDKPGLKAVPHYSQFDPYLNKFKKGYLRWGNRHPVQRLKKFVVKRMLSGKKSSYFEKPDLPSISDEIDLTEPVQHFLLNAGIQAPSGDNAQPWKLKVLEKKIQVLLDPKADQSFFNVNQIASIISCGAVMENIKIAATMLEWDAQIDYPDEDFEHTQQTPVYPVMGQVAISEKKTEPDILYDSIWQRHTNRTFYKKNQVFPQVALGKCQNQVSGIPGSHLYSVSGKKDLKALAKIVYQADRIRTEYRPLHDHLNKMIRYSDRQMEETCDGLPIKNLEAGFAGELFLKISRPWQIMNIFNKTGIGKMVALHSYQGIVNSSAVMLLTMNGTQKTDFLEGGRALQRIWLELTRLGFHIQPMTAITLFSMRILLGQKDQFLPRHLKMLESMKEPYFQLFPGLKETDGQIMLFRVGQGKAIGQHTRRKPINRFLISQ